MMEKVEGYFLMVMEVKGFKKVLMIEVISGLNIWKRKRIRKSMVVDEEKVRRNEERSLINTSFLGEYECSSLALEREGSDENKRLDHLKQDQEMLVIKIFNERKKVFRERKKLDVVFDGAFGGVRDEEVVVGEGVVVTSSSLDMLTNSCLGGIMVSLIFLEGLDEEALVEFMVE
ncbi:hypothetical protein Tco_0686942 [Tanacetum coccineum]